MISKTNVAMLVVASLVSAIAFAAPRVKEYVPTQAEGVAINGMNAMKIRFAYDGKQPVSAAQFLIDLSDTGYEFVNSSKCMSGVPDTHKGDGALSSCRIIDRTKLGVVLSDVASFATLPNGVLGWVTIKRSGSAKAGGGDLRIRELALFDSNSNRIDASAYARPIVLEFAR